MMLRTVCMCGALLIASSAQAQQGRKTQQSSIPLYELTQGFATMNDGTFNYQGYLEVNGEPANGMYSFQFEAFDEPTGPGILSELFYFSPLIPVVDGLFSVDVQMGGTDVDARRFWREVGDQEMYLEIGVSEIKGGPYEILTTRAKVGWSARAQYSGIAESLRFPYSDVFDDGTGDPVTMISLSNAFGGTILELIDGDNTDDPILDILGETTFGLDFSTQNGAVRIDAMSERVGLLAAGNEFAVVGLLPTGASFADTAVLGQVQNSVSGNAVSAINSESNTFAILGTPTHAGSFGGDVLINGNLQIEGEPVRDFGSNDLSPVGPIAYGFIASNGSLSSGTANLSSTWDSANSQYLLTIADEFIVNGPYTAIVTVVDSFEPRLATTNASGGLLAVKIWDLNSGNIAIQDNFQVVVYESDPGAFLIRGAPDGVDSDKYYEQTGTAPIVGTNAQPQSAEQASPVGIGD